MDKTYITLVNIEGEWSNSQELYINGHWDCGVQDLSECPEDAIIGRDLITCYDIEKAIEKGYEIAKQGKEIVFDSIEIDKENEEEFDCFDFLRKKYGYEGVEINEK